MRPLPRDYVRRRRSASAGCPDLIFAASSRLFGIVLAVRRQLEAGRRLYRCAVAPPPPLRLNRRRRIGLHFTARDALLVLQSGLDDICDNRSAPCQILPWFAPDPFVPTQSVAFRPSASEIEPPPRKVAEGRQECAGLGLLDQVG